MRIPTVHQMHETLRGVVEKEDITARDFVDPIRIFSLLYKYRYIQFFLVGAGGVLLDLAVSWLLTTFVFGLERYFTAYLFGIAVNLLWNFTIYTRTIFKTRHYHVRRFAVFLVWSIGMTILQAYVVRFITPLVGLQYYLLVIAGVILFFSFINFFVFKLSIFRERPY